MLDAGDADRLMLDWWDGDWNLDYTEILSPAVAEHGGVRAPEVTWARRFKGRCVFLTGADRCELHRTGRKPAECRGWMHGHDGLDHRDAYHVHLEVARLWASWEGRALVERWQSLVARGAA